MVRKLASRARLPLVIAARKSCEVFWGNRGRARARPDPPPRCHPSIYLLLWLKKKENGLKIHFWALFFLKKYIAKSEGGKTISCHHSRPPGKTRRRRYFLTWCHMKQKRTARGHLCVTHEVKAKHDLSSDVCKFSKTKIHFHFALMHWLRSFFPSTLQRAACDTHLKSSHHLFTL